MRKYLTVSLMTFSHSQCYGDIRGMRIYLCGDISSGHSDMINEPSGFVNIINNHNVIVLNCNYSWDFSYTVGQRDFPSD